MDFFRLVLDRLHEDLKYSVPSSALLDESGNRKNRRKSGRLAQKNGDSDSDSEKVQFKSVIKKMNSARQTIRQNAVVQKNE